jgi:hypothetical protein
MSTNLFIMVQERGTIGDASHYSYGQTISLLLLCVYLPDNAKPFALLEQALKAIDVTIAEAHRVCKNKLSLVIAGDANVHVQIMFRARVSVPCIPLDTSCSVIAQHSWGFVVHCVCIYNSLSTHLVQSLLNTVVALSFIVFAVPISFTRAPPSHSHGRCSRCMLYSTFCSHSAHHSCVLVVHCVLFASLGRWISLLCGHDFLYRSFFCLCAMSLRDFASDIPYLRCGALTRKKLAII